MTQLKPPKLVGYVVKDDRLEEKRAVLKAKADELKMPLRRLLVDRGPPGLLNRSWPWRQIRRNLEPYDMLLAWLSDLGGKRKELRSTLEFLCRRGLMLFLILDDREWIQIPYLPRHLGLKGLAPEGLRMLEVIIDRVNRQHQVEQFRRSVQRRRKQHRRVSFRPPLGKKFLRRGDKVFVVKDAAFYKRVAQIRKWREEGATIDECQRRLSRLGARNPATGRVWSKWRIERALKVA